MAEAYRVFGSYLRFKEIVSDPLGSLYRAGEFSSTGVVRTVWLRVFDRAEIPADDIIRDFERTQKISGAVKSSSVASGVEGVVADGVPGIACDYVPSQPLSVIFDRAAAERFPVPVDNALLVLEKVSLALSATLTVEIDGSRVVHGFVHPCLILVTNDGEGIVTGFGIGDHLLALIDDEANAATIHPYLAPEVLSGRVPSRRGDVYSLGALLFHLLTGEILPVPPEARADAIASAHLAYDDERVPNDIKSLMQKALAERPDERFSSAADFKKELDKLLYGGAYSPTTFNLALFMDRLFRDEIEEEESERAGEKDVDVTPYLAPQIAPEPEQALELEEVDAPPAAAHRKGLWLGVGAIGAIAAAVAIWASLGRGPSTPPLPPTPTAEEIAAQREAQEQKMRELAQGLVQEMMAEKEAEIRQELLDRQAKIEELQQKLVQSERRAQEGQLSRDEQKTREELQRQIQAEESAQRQREAELEAERQRAADEAQRQAAAAQTATAAAAEEERLAAAAIAAQAAETPTPTPPPPAPRSTPLPTATAVATTAAAIEKNTFVDPSEVDSLPIIIKEAQVDWPRAAMKSLRRGVVIVQVTVDADGHVEDAKLLRADHEEFGIAQAVVDAARKYRFKPGTKDGVPIKTHATVTKVYRFVSSNRPTKRTG